MFCLTKEQDDFVEKWNKNSDLNEVFKDAKN